MTGVQTCALPICDVKHLTDVEPPEYRLSIGAYRVRFYDLGDAIEILRVLPRDKAYR